MFSGIASSASPSSTPPLAPKPRQKRAQVARACDACRAHRTKCDDGAVCQACRSRGMQCSNSGASRLGTLSLAQREIDRLKKQIQELQQELQQRHNQTASAAAPYEHQVLTPVPSPFETSQLGVDAHSIPLRDVRRRFWEGVHVVTARSPHETWYGQSSLFYFIKRVTAVLSDGLQQNLSATTVLPSGASKLLHGPTSPAGEGPDRVVGSPVGGTLAVGVYLSPTQEEYFISLFWQAYHTSLFAIIDEAEFTNHHRSLWTAGATTRRQSALVDIVIAICMQYGLSMLPATKQGVLVDNNDATIAGRWHYKRCQTLLAYELESPTITTLQCHLLCCVYLCCGTFQNMADSACGLAVRTAYMLGLHLEPHPSISLRERESRKRLWWAIYILDSKIGMKLGRPFALHDSHSAPSLPSDSVEVAALSGSNFAPLGDNVTWLSFNLHHIQLFQTARAAHTAYFNRDFNLGYGRTIWDAPETLSTLAHLISPYTQRFDEWVKGVPDALKTKRQHNGTPFSIDITPLDIEQFAPAWIQRQRLLLELMYHNLSMNLYRPFIALPNDKVQVPLRDEAVLCAAHAITLTHILHQVLSSSSILDGWHEAFQWQWNAAVTLVGFMLAYPDGPSTETARSAVDLSITTFDIFGKSFPVAANTAVIIRDLSAKIAFLTAQSCAKPIELVASTFSSTGHFSFEGESVAMDSINDSFDIDAFIAEQQDVYDMALAVDLWGDLGTLWPETGGVLPQYLAVA